MVNLILLPLRFYPSVKMCISLRWTQGALSVYLQIYKHQIQRKTPKFYNKRKKGCKRLFGSQPALLQLLF